MSCCNNRVQFTVQKTFKFCAAHRLLNHKGKCRHLHGHNYVVTAAFGRTDDNLDLASMMVVDFAALKPLQQWIDDNWDHATILNVNDSTIADAVLKAAVEESHESRLFVMDYDPTAEAMAEALTRLWANLLPSGIRIVSIGVQETDTCEARIECPC